MQETLKANPYVYADNDAVNEIDPSGANCEGAIIDGFFGVLGVVTATQTFGDSVVAAILAVSFLPPSAAFVLAGVVAWLILYITVYEVYRIIDGVLPQCGINFSFGY